MELPIDQKDLKTIVNALSLGGDTRLYHLLRGYMVTEEYEVNGTVLNEDYSHYSSQCDI